MSQGAAARTRRAVVVHVPRSMGGAVWREVLRRHPAARARVYRGDPYAVRRSPGDVVVAVRRDNEKRPRRGHAAPGSKSALGCTWPGLRVVLVFVNDVRLAARLRWADPRLPRAVGHVLAHELEHLRRGSGVHDRSGWFRGCVTRPKDLLS